MAQQLMALYCTQYDVEARTCSQQAWMVPPSLLPPISYEDVCIVLPSIVMCFLVAWGFNFLLTVVRD